MSDCRNDKCVVSGIIRFAKELESASTSRSEKINALRILAHLVGDIHQPLHVAHPDGLGGNRTKPRFYGVRKKLHAIWDTAILNHHLEVYRQWDDDEWEPDLDLSDSNSIAWEVYAAELSRSISSEERSKWQRDLSPLKWANESFAIAKEHTFAIGGNGELGDDYYHLVMPEIDRRLRQGGVRLAAVLNVIFDPAQELEY